MKTKAIIFKDCRRQPIEDVEVPGMDQQNEDLQIPGVNANQVDNIDLPGVDGEQKESPQTIIAQANNDVIEIDDLDIAQPDQMEHRTGSAQRSGNRTAHRSGNHRETYGTNRIPDCASTSDAGTRRGHR